MRQLFAIIHDRLDYHSKADFRNELENQGIEVWTAVMYHATKTKEAQNLAQRFRKHGGEYIRVTTTPGIEPTNNLAEQTIRFVVLDRRVIQGTRSEAGRNRCERISTAIATCAQHGRNAFSFLTQSVQSLLTNTPRHRCCSTPPDSHPTHKPPVATHQTHEGLLGSSPAAT